MRTRAEWEARIAQIERDLEKNPPPPKSWAQIYREAEEIMDKLDVARRKRYRLALEEQIYPRCRVPGCCFRSVTCPVHDVEEPPGFRAVDSMIRQLPAGGRRGGRRG